MSLTSEPAYRKVAQAIRDQILEGDLEPGDRLPVEGDLATRFGVSRSTVREALRSLASQNLVVTTRGVSGGSFVARPDTDHMSNAMVTSLDLLTMVDEIGISELLEAREMLEIPAAGLAAQRRTAAQLAEIEETLPDTPRDLSSTFEASRDLHLLIADASGNRLLKSMTRPIFVVLQTRFLRDRAPRTFWRQVHHEHRSIVAAIAAGDRVSAEYEMREHLRHLRRIYELIDKRNAP